MNDLFGNETPPIPKKKKSNQRAINAHGLLRQLHGEANGEKCKDCVFFLERRFSKTYFKCEKVSTSRSESTDWRANWKACGKFEKNE